MIGSIAAIHVVVGLNVLELKELLIVHRLNVSVSMHYLLLVALVYFHDFLYNGDLLDCELDATQLDDVSSLHDIVNLAVVVLQAPNYQVHVLVKLLGHGSDAPSLQHGYILLRSG